jgi:hypothetical protein
VTGGLFFSTVRSKGVSLYSAEAGIMRGSSDLATKFKSIVRPEKESDDEDDLDFDSYYEGNAIAERMANASLSSNNTSRKNMGPNQVD